MSVLISGPFVQLFNSWIPLAFGGILGTFCRYGLSLWLNPVIQTTRVEKAGSLWGALPLGTLLVNSLGCLIIGIALAFTEQFPSVPASLRLFIITGFLGAFTTLSAFELELFQTLRMGQWAVGLIYLMFTVIGGFVLISLGYWASVTVLASPKSV